MGRIAQPASVAQNASHPDYRPLSWLPNVGTNLSGSANASSVRQDVEKSSPEGRPSPVTWRLLPNKAQLGILAGVRLVDFFQVASLQTYMFHQLKSFDPSLPDSSVALQAGVLQGVFTSAQILTAIIWGRVADAPWAGRKRVLLVGLVGTGLSCIGVGYSSTFEQAVVFRCVGGAINGTVGAARTMVAESVEKKYHPRAFLLLPVAFNIASVFGPSKSFAFITELCPLSFFPTALSSPSH